MPLFQGMLSHLQRSRETPLQFEIDSRGIVAVVLEAFPLDGITGHGTDPRDEWKAIEAGLDSLAARTLCEEPVDSGTQDPDPGATPACSDCNGQGGRGSPGALCEPFAAWLERYYQIMREVSPHAIDIASLRAEGFRDRDIAERLGLGLRMVAWIVREMRSNWETAPDKE